MTDLSTLLPQFPVELYQHLLSCLESHAVSTADLIATDVLETAKRVQLPLPDLCQLRGLVIERLRLDLGIRSHAHDSNGTHNAQEKARNGLPGPPLSRFPPQQWRAISTLDSGLDDAIGGGIPTKYLTEITGESGAGKTQILLMLLLAVQCLPPLGLSQDAIYVTTEGALATSRLEQIISAHPRLCELPEQLRPSLDGIHVVAAKDLEAQDHIIQYGLPPAVQKLKAGLVVIDSIAANFRSDQGSSAPKDLADRHTQLVRLGHTLRQLARKEDIAIVVANQVSDRLEHVSIGQGFANMAVSSSPPRSSPAPLPPPMRPPSSASAKSYLSTLTLDHQQLFFSGWGDNNCYGNGNLKTPALGLSWTNQISCRIALKIEASRSYPVTTNEPLATNTWHSWRKRRFAKLVLASWTAKTEEIEFDIKKEGVFAIGGRGPSENS